MNLLEWVWPLIAVAAVGTFSLRLSFLVLLEKVQEPAWFRKALQYLPPAIMGALVSSSLLVQGGELHLDIHNHRLLAGLLAGAIGWKTRSLLWTILSGLLALVALNALLGTA